VSGLIPLLDSAFPSIRGSGSHLHILRLVLLPTGITMPAIDPHGSLPPPNHLAQRVNIA